MTAFAEPNDGLVEQARRRVGAILNGKWRLDGLLGVGGMAAVYAATHRNGHRVAIKVLHTHFSLDEGFCSKLQQEGHVANLIEHPGALRILDDDRAEDGSVFLVMELLSGEGLDARLKRKGWRLPISEVLGISFRVLDVLAAAHARGIVHRDIKPDNVFITREAEVKVLDFGIARLMDLPQGMTRTRNGALFGTLGFMAPEQALGRTAEIDNRTDLWAVGATMFTLLTGRLVHEAPTPNEQLVCSATRAAPPIASILPEIDPGLAQLIDRALAFNPADRWPSAGDMQVALQEVALHIDPDNVALHAPRLSQELEIDGVLQLAGARSGRWTSASLPSFPSMMVRPPAQPTLVARPPRRFPRMIAGVALATALGGGVLVHCTRPQPLQAEVPGTHGEPPALDRAGDSTPTGARPAPVTTPVPAPVPAAATAVSLLPGELDDAAAAPDEDVPPHLVAADEGPPQAKKVRRRSLRRLPQAVRRTPAPARESAADDDLWDRRH
jgi:serine/threonine-protein kinase